MREFINCAKGGGGFTFIDGIHKLNKRGRRGDFTLVREFIVYTRGVRGGG